MMVHTIAQSGFGHGNDLYDRARPSYQPAALSYIRQNLRGEAPLNVAEIGAGTGIFTRALLVHPDWASDINEIKAVEPSSGMREVFAKTVEDNRVTLYDGTFEKTALPDGWADVIIIAQAFHWCVDYERACREFSRILKSTGAAVFIWNLEDRDQARWVLQLRDRIERHEAGTPQFRLNLWRQAFDASFYKQFFQPPLENVWKFNLPTTSDIAVDRASSKSYIAVLPEEEKDEVRREVRAIVDKGEDKVWIAEDEGIFEYPYKCYVVVAQRT